MSALLSFCAQPHHAVAGFRRGKLRTLQQEIEAFKNVTPVSYSPSDVGNFTTYQERP